MEEALLLWRSANKPLESKTDPNLQLTAILISSSPHKLQQNNLILKSSINENVKVTLLTQHSSLKPWNTEAVCSSERSATQHKHRININVWLNPMDTLRAISRVK